jgi:SpoVK/Ycf46/Vps4 family AAA+-type ATPase
MVRSWSRDLELGNRNKIVFVTSALAEINDTIRSSDAWVKHITIKKPNLDQRQTWLSRYNDNLKAQADAGNPQRINGRNWTEVVLSPGESLEDIAIQAAGMNFKQMEGPIVQTAIQGIPLTVNIIKKAKQSILESEYGGMLEFLEPRFGFDNIGGHEHLKRYARERIINPLKKRLKDVCTDGVILTGPPGTGKTEWASSLAYESGMTFLVGHLDKLKDKYVGNSEKMMAKFLDGVRAASPCILFMDEFDSVFGVHARQGAGDGGVQNGQFNAFMQFASDPSRRGEIVLVAATNAPQLLDPALVRPGRFSDMLPTLPPKPEDWAGKMQILFAIMNRKGMKFAADLAFDAKTGPSDSNPLSLLCRDKRFWTGAEINKLVEDMILNAQLAEDDRKKAVKGAAGKFQFRIMGEDVAAAFNNVIPKTGAVKEMIASALYFMNSRRYIPVGWEKELAEADQAKEKGEAYRGSASFDRE